MSEDPKPDGGSNRPIAGQPPDPRASNGEGQVDSPQHAPSDDTRRFVRMLSGRGVTPDNIGLLLEVTTAKLHEHYSRELQLGSAEANATVTASLHDQAASGSVPAANLWMNSRASVSERTKGEERSLSDEERAKKLRNIMVYVDGLIARQRPADEPKPDEDRLGNVGEQIERPATGSKFAK